MGNSFSLCFAALDSGGLHSWSFLNMAGLHIFGISDESTETKKSYTNFNDELRWLWNSVYIYLSAKEMRKY